jgi:hypothetical protein
MNLDASDAPVAPVAEAPFTPPPATLNERRAFAGRAPLATSWRQAVRSLTHTAVALLILSVLTKTLQRFDIERYSWTAAQVISHFDIDVEGSVPTWFSNLILFFAAVQLLLIGYLQRRRRGRLASYWTGLGALFVLMSMDEITGFHNIPIVSENSARAVSDFLAISWVVHGMVGVAALGLLFIPFLRALPRATAVGFICAGLVYVGGALVMEMIGAHFIYTLGFTHPVVAAVLTVEEGMEMFGVILMIATLFGHIEREFPGLGVSVTAPPNRG